MSFPRHPKYKASGVEWLGEVPEHWGVARLKNILLRSITDGPHTTPEFLDEGVPFLSVDGIQDGELQFGGCRYVSDADHAEYRMKAFPRRDDLLMGKAASTGKIARVKVDFEFSIWSPLALIRVDGKVSSPAFVEYALKSPITQAQIDTFCTANTQKNISMDDIPKLVLARPPFAEQTQIAVFLERETEKIDGLVAEQRRLIDLLKEKRQAVISHAVTKGLNPHAHMKPSGIDWLGDVPAHWRVVPLKRIVATPITDGPHETPEFVDEGVPFVSAEAISSGSIDFTKVRACISEEDNARYSVKYSPRLRDIYMVKSGATTGITAIVEGRTDFNIWSPLAAIRCGSSIFPHFVLNFMRSRNFLEAVTLNWSFGTQQNIGMGVIENLACTVPSLEEQNAIAEFLRVETAKADALTSEAERAIDLLQERRTALISAAVTGTIDVRGLVDQQLVATP